GVFAVGASRDRRITEITNKVEQGLRAPAWTEAQLQNVEGLIADLSRLAPVQAEALRARLPKALAASIRAADLTRARGELSLLERLDPAEAARLAGELRQRETTWPLVFKLEAPFADLNAVFEAGKAQVAGQSLRSASAGAVRTRKACEGNVEMKGEFDGAWKEASQIGLLFNNPGDAS